MPADLTPERLAQLFHETYERLAPEHGYRTREASAKPWTDVPAANRALMTATCGEVLDKVRPNLYREAAARLREICDRNGHGGDCCLTCDRGSDVDLLESLAGEMDQARAAGLEGRGDDH